MTTNPATYVLRNSGSFFAFALDALRSLVRRPFQVRELVQQAWFISSVSILPAALVSIPFGAVIALQLGSLVKQLGAQSFTGAASVLAVVREAGPIVTAIIIAGAGGSAICADLGARKIREELDAMEVLGINPIQRLVVPRVIASMGVALLLNGLVSVVGVAGGYAFNVVLQGGTPGAYLASFQALGQLPDLVVGEIKALVFGATAALVASYKGMTAKGGPKGVGDAVNQSVVITFMLLFALNFVITAIYFQVVPQKGS
jgi:phospholipid/cholesterol/gamma-HCH transport system permease protein